MDKLRTCTFRPYVGAPHFTLTMWDSGTQRAGKTVIHYRLRMTSINHRAHRVRTTIFEAADFAGSPMHADDSDETVRSLMTFLTLRPGDTDADYFASYTPKQLEFRDRHAEALAAEVARRFGEG